MLLILASVQFFSIVDFMVVMPLGPQLRRTLGIDTFQFGLIVSSYTVSAGVAGLLGSSVLDRFGRKRAFLTLFIGFLVGTMLCGLSVNYATLLFARIVTGAFGGILGGMALAIIGDVFPEERRGRATGVLMSSFALASVVGVPICMRSVPGSAGMFRSWLWLRSACRSFCWPCGSCRRSAITWRAGFIPTHGYRFATPSTMPTTSRLRPDLRHHVWRFLRHPLHQPLSGEQRGRDRTEPDVGLRDRRPPDARGSALIGRLADRFGKLTVYRVVASVAACLMLVVTTLIPVPLALAVGVVGALMLSNAGRMVAGLAIVTGPSSSQRGGFMSANSAVQHLASGLGAFVGGKIIVSAGDGILLHFGRVGIMAMAATLLTLWLAGRVRSAESPHASHHVTAEATQPAASSLR